MSNGFENNDQIAEVPNPEKLEEDSKLLLQKEILDPKKKYNVMVIDDEESIRIALKGILSKSGYNVDTFEDFESAKDRLFSDEYDALILDIILPEIDGIEILHKINKSGVNLPTIMLTGAPSLTSAQNSVRFGAFDYLIKPVDKELLLTQLKNAIQKRYLILKNKELMGELKVKNAELEKLVDERTKELEISELRYRALVESVSDCILILNSKGLIKFANVVFLDKLLKASTKNVNNILFKEIVDKPIGEFIDKIGNLDVNELITKISVGEELELKGITFNKSYNFPDSEKYNVLTHGIFDSDFELKEIILTFKAL
ncbi:MAG: response regulator [Promethearchaeota archaeon]